MIKSRDILSEATRQKLRPDVVEKDYVLGWLLAGISAHPVIRKSWIFKGGTCLKKCYFGDYRFSEDLDFTLTDGKQVNEDFLMKAMKQVTGWVYERSGIEFPESGTEFEVYKSSQGREYCQGKVSYRGPVSPNSGGFPRVKFDLTADEDIVLPSELRKVHHPYPDEPEGGIQANCYAYEEIFAEKIRALSDRVQARDLYDVVNLFAHKDRKPKAASVKKILIRKCEFKGLPVPTLAALKDRQVGLDAAWKSMLGHQLPELPDAAKYWKQLPKIFDWLGL